MVFVRSYFNYYSNHKSFYYKNLLINIIIYNDNILINDLSVIIDENL